jgi:hypothetical protein
LQQSRGILRSSALKLVLKLVKDGPFSVLRHALPATIFQPQAPVLHGQTVALTR